MDRPPSSTYSFGDFRLDTERRLLLRQNGQPVALMPKAFDTLRYLVEHAGKTVEKDDLMSAVWPDTVVEENNLSQNISALRKVLGEKRGEHRYIVTVPGRGFKFVADVGTKGSPPDGSLNVVRNDHGSKIETRPGRIYVLQDWVTGRNPSGQRSQAVPAVRPVETSFDSFPDEALRFAGHSVARKERRTAIYLSALAFLAVTASVISVYVLRFRGAKENSGSAAVLSVTPLTSRDDVHGPTISRDGKLFAYHTYDGDRQRLMLQHTGQLTPVEILAPTDLILGEKTFSPDGGEIYFLARNPSDADNSLYRMGVLGGTPRKILTGLQALSAVTFSPDGTEFAFVRSNRDTKEYSIVRVYSNGSGEREVLRTGNAETLSYPAWSPDGKEIAFVHHFISGRWKDHYVTIGAVNADGGSVRQLVEKLANCFRIAWTKDGKGLVFSGTKLGDVMTGRRDQVWYVDLYDLKITRISPEGDRYVFGGLTDNDDAIIGTIDRISQMWRMDVSGDAKTAFQLTRGKTDGRTGIAPLPDGRVAYTTRNGDNWEIWVMDGDGSAAALVYNGNPTVEEIRATPDGKYLVFNANADGSGHLFRIGTDGGDLKQLTYGDDIWVSDATAALDGSVVYQRNSFAGENLTESVALYRVSINGGESLPVTGVPQWTSTPHFSPAGDKISFIDQNRLPVRLGTLSIDNSDLRIFDLKYRVQTNVGAIWTPDGKSLAYIVYENNASNIWLQPISGGHPRQLTDFTSGHIYRAAYSMDGKYLYLARGYATNNAVLIKGFVN